MAVLVEGISVIVRRDSIDRAYRGGWDAFVASVPNATLCFDGEIARVGFMAPQKVGNYIDVLAERGLTFLEDDKAKDIAVADQQRGLTASCEWLEFGRLRYGEGDDKVSACWLFEGSRIAAGIHMRGRSMQLSTPSGWEFEGSLSQKFSFIPTDEVEERLQFVRSDGNVDVYIDLDTGREVYIGH